jgi:hypothetical protein
MNVSDENKLKGNWLWIIDVNVLFDFAHADIYIPQNTYHGRILAPLAHGTIF